MDRENAVRIMREHIDDLQSLGVKSLALFGSTARNEARLESDVDILVEFNAPLTFDRFMETKFYLEEILGNPVDLVVQKNLRPRIKPHIESEAIYVT